MLSTVKYSHRRQSVWNTLIQELIRDGVSRVTTYEPTMEKIMRLHSVILLSCAGEPCFAIPLSISFAHCE